MAICISYSDIIRWNGEKRRDILREISFTKNAPQGAGFYVGQTILGPEKKPCPFLVDNLCGIHPTKPMVCKDAPTGFTKFEECPAWKPEHINRKRLKKVQRRQAKDFNKCVTYFKDLFDIIIKDREWQLKNNM
jgi:Fe-S-cluster containining protein